ncbi:SOS response-associated peptidase family protein [Herbaspirillum sp. B65]|uniref:SOS response-associated peptidase family protein n=1 Tax=Herbaspirillum sp. B65 TaxID=137708 RepID=UPI0005CA5EC4|nr:SOS response-associated peptidase family protein [Herbaspirillum sp. B65]
MCVNYKPAAKEVVASLTGVDTSGTPDWSEEVWQDYEAPIVGAGQEGEPELIVGTYGMVPKRKMREGLRLSTMNARPETVGQKRTFSKQWRETQTCLLPMSMFFEPNWEAGTPERWAIGTADDEPFCVAGLWKAWEEEQGSFSFSFTQLTINADDHPLMKRFHNPGDEKRSLVIVPRSEYETWLNVKAQEVARMILSLYPAELMKAWPAPRPKSVTAKRPSATKGADTKGKKDCPETGSLF